MREYELSVNENAIPNCTSNGVEDFFQNNKELYNIILIEYMEYMIDLSINEETVHWCGHSEQPLSEPFNSFEKEILAENKKYLNYLRTLQENTLNKTFQQDYFAHELDFLELVEVKPLTIKKII